MHESIQGVHGAMTSDIQDGQKRGMMQMYVVIIIEVKRSIQCVLGEVQ